MSGAGDLRQPLKRGLSSVLPAPLMTRLLGAWRGVFWRWHARRARWRERATLQRLLASGAPIWLELGSGRRDGMDGWIFSDLGGGGDLALELTEPLPFPDGCVQRLYCSHVLEHFGYPSPMRDLLRECHRVLEARGTLSVAVPDARPFIRGYLEPGSFDLERFCSHDVGLRFRAPMDILNFVAHLGGEHKHLFDDRNLVDVLEEAGFREVRLRDHDPAIDLPERRHESLYAVAVK